MNLEFLRLDLIAPELFLLLAGFFILLIDLFCKTSKNYSFISIIFHLIAAGWVMLNFNLEGEGFYGFIFANKWSNSLKLLLIIGSLLCTLISPSFLKHYKINFAEFYFLLHIVLVSMLLLVSSSQLLFIYLCLETASLTSFVLSALNRNSKFSSEAAIKYFLLNAFSSAILLYGIALIFGNTGSFNLETINEILIKQAVNNLVILSVIFITLGFAFKISLVPFHMWAPDLYEGVPLNLTAFFSTPLKIAFIAVFTKICLSAFMSYSHIWSFIILILSILSILAGSLLAMVQTKIKRVLAYSSIAHAGFLMMGLLSFKSNGIIFMFFYFTIYTFSNLGIFASFIYLTGKKEIIYFEDLIGSGFKHPIVASFLILCCFSLTGIPLTGGFIGKFYLFHSSLESNYFLLVVAALLGSAISAGYYLKFSIKLFTKNSISVENNIQSSSLLICLFICVGFILLLGVFPSLLQKAVNIPQLF